MSRSCWKIIPNTFDLVGMNDRRRRVFVYDVGSVVSIHNGKTSVGVRVQRPMVGLLFGDLVLTKRLGGGIHKRRTKKKKKKK
jgi:ribosomal protein S19